MEVSEQIKQYIAETFLFSDDGFNLGDDVSFLDEGIIDSMGVLELIMFVEETFGISVEDDEIKPENFDSVNKLCGYIERKNSAAVEP
ncbi:MAG: acyl carrier protein [Ardenticatenaceae bacterium]|nr:acyl carrier protein [Ardenticatenaceae bacterium]MCB9445053.1 acyl carrier protein [Ardenticatenaceae bacterium]